VHRDQVRKALPVPGHVDPLAGQRQVGQRDVGVGRAGRGIRHLGRGFVGVGRVGDVPARHGRLIDPGGQHAGGVRRPPIAAEPAHLLGRDELGQPPGDALLAGEHAVGGGAAYHAQDPIGDVGDPFPVR